MRNIWFSSAAGVVTLVAAVCVGCAENPTREGKSSSADNIVDCLVPGQIRQLDEKVTIATQRQMIRTTREECRNRGGEEQPAANK